MMTTNGQAADNGGSQTPGAADARECLSALMDGELGGGFDADATREACARWQADADCRRDWHRWHLIGDVLRSEELAVGAHGDAAFLASLRIRMVGEPIVFAPAPLPATLAARRRSRWLMPGAAAAGFVLVAGTFVALRVAQPGPGVAPGGVDRTAAAGGTPAAIVAVREPAAPAAADLSVGSGRVIRDPRLDRYLAAHKQFAGSTAPGWPQGAIRNATVQVEGR